MGVQVMSTVFVSTLLVTSVLSAPTWSPWSAWPSYKHVVVISVDGMHASDLDKYVALKPNSAFSALLETGIKYENGYTSGPSDSFPGTSAPFTGGSPVTTGIWYDDVWDWTWYDPGSDCKGTAGTEVQYAENIDFNSSLLWSGGIDPSQLPLAIVGGKCTSMYPHQRLQVNTVFEVVHAANLQTAYTDKHPAYDLVRGPSGTGLTTGYFPEIAAVPNTVNGVIKYDSLHVQAWLDWIDGITPVNSTYGSLTTGQMPALMGGNFQVLNVAQKTAGYLADLSFSPNITQALDFVDMSIGQIVSKLQAKSLLNDTLIIVASKHGQAPIDKKLLNKIDPDLLMNATGVPTAFIIADDIAMIWLNQTSDIPKAAANLQAKASQLGIQEVIYGQGLIDQGFGDSSTSARIPQIIVRPNLGVIYTTGSKVEEHGGLSDDDRHIACFVSNPKLSKQVITPRVETKQIAPSILKALGLDATALEAVVKEGTAVLPGLFPGWEFHDLPSTLH